MERIPARIGGILSFVFRSPVTASCDGPAKETEDQADERIHMISYRHYGTDTGTHGKTSLTGQICKVQKTEM